MNLAQSKQCWIIMRWGMPEEYKHPRAAYFNRCLDKIEDSSSYKGEIKLIVESEGEKPKRKKHTYFKDLKKVRRRLLPYLREGKKNHEAIKKIKADSTVNLNYSDGTPAPDALLATICTRMRKDPKLKIPPLFTMTDKVLKLIDEGVSDADILDKLNITAAQLSNVKYNKNIRGKTGSKIIKKEMNNGVS